MKSVPHLGKPDILIAFTLGNDKDVISMDQAKKSGPARFFGKGLEKRGNNLGIIQVVQNMTRQKEQRRSQGIGLRLRVLLHQSKLTQCMENGVALALMDSNLFTDLRQFHFEAPVFSQTEEDPGRLLNRRNRGVINGLLSGEGCLHSVG
jgi:hypothetical protein